MSNFGLIRRDYAAGNKIRLGITAYVIIFLLSLVCFTYLFLRMSGFGPTMLKTDFGEKDSPNSIPTNVGSIGDSLSTWQPNALDADGNAHTVDIQNTSNNLSTQTAVYSELRGQTFSGGSQYDVGKLAEGLEQISGDDGGLYIKSNFNVFTMNVPAGTKLTGKKNTSYLVGEDLKLYQVTSGGKRIPVTIAPEYKLWDDQKRSYTVTKNLVLRLHTPGPKGRFVGPDKKAYNVLASGDIEDAESSEIVPYIPGSGEFTGTDNKQYVVMRGLLFQDSLGNASFGAKSLGGNGYFKGPDGKSYLLGEDGKVYLLGKDGALTPSNIGGSGNFIGPDGATYFKDENGDIHRIVSSGENGIAQKTSLPKGFFIGPDGKKYYVNENGEVFAVDSNGTLTPAKIGGTGIFRGPDGKLYKVNADGSIVPVESSDISKNISSPNGIYLTGPDGKKYFVDKDGKSYLVDENGNLIPAVLPKGVYIDENGNTYTSDGLGSPLKALSQKIPTGTYTDSTGQRYYVNDNGEFFKINPDGSLTKLDELPKNTMLREASGAAFLVDSNGNVRKSGLDALANGYFTGPDGKRYFKDKNGQVFLVDKDGKLQPIDAIPAGTFIGPDGQLYHSDGNGNVTKLSNTDSAKVPEGYFYGPDGKLYFSDKDGNIFELQDGKLIPRDRLPSGTFIGPDGKRYIIDENGNIVPDTSYVSSDANNTNDTKPEALPNFGVLSPVQYSNPLLFPEDPKKRSAKVNVTQNLSNFDTGEKNFEPVQAAKDIKGGRVYTRSIQSSVVSKVASQKGNKVISPTETKDYSKFMPIGTRIPFYLLTHISTSLDRGSLIEGVVAENVFFHKCAIPAGTRLYGTMGAVGKNNRIGLNFTMLQYPNGKSISISADTYDVNMQFGLESYWTPAPIWVTALKFANVGAIAALAQTGRKNSETGESIADLSEVQNYMEETIDEIIADQTGYHTLPAGTPGVLMLTQNLDLSEISFEGSGKLTEKNVGLLSDEERLKRMKDNAEAAYQQQMIDAAKNGGQLSQKLEMDAQGKLVRRISLENNNIIPSAEDIRAQYDAQRQNILQHPQGILPGLSNTPNKTNTQSNTDADLSKIFK